jgi:hypothetical protein
VVSTHGAVHKWFPEDKCRTIQDDTGPIQDHTGAEWYGNTRPVPIACSGCTQLAGGTW